MPSRQSVVVIDCDPLIREMLAIILADAGYDVQSVPDGASASPILQNSPIPVTVLVDVVPPWHLSQDHSVVDLLDRVVEEASTHDGHRDGHELDRHTYILTSTDPHDAMAWADILPPHLSLVVLIKPYDLDTLRETIATASARSHSADRV